MQRKISVPKVTYALNCLYNRLIVSRITFFAQCVRAKHARPVLSTGPKTREERVAIAHAPLASEGSGAERLRMRTDYLSCA